MSFSIPPPQIATPLDQKPKGMISPYQHQNEDLQLRVFDFYNAGKLIFIEGKIRIYCLDRGFQRKRSWSRKRRTR